MYRPHPGAVLQRLFVAKPWQNARPEDATYLFVGLDANYAPDVEDGPAFDTLVAYHDDGPAFWRAHGVHHPFLLPTYRGDGRAFHRGFAAIGFTPAQADEVSFIELLHVPTTGRNVLDSADLSMEHLDRIAAAMRFGAARHVFVSATALRLMRASGRFDWLGAAPTNGDGALRVLWRDGRRTVYLHLHFSTYGKFLGRKASEAAAIRALWPDHGRG